MQLTSPFFVFIFLPLTVLAVLVTPRRFRVPTLLVLSLFWLLTVNSPDVWTALSFLAVVGCALLPDLFVHTRAWRAVAVACGIFLPLALLLAVRILAIDKGLLSYPVGLTFIALGAVSLTADRLAARLGKRERATVTLGAMLPFPFMTVGPLIGAYRLHGLRETIRPSLSGISYGVRLFMQGYVKILLFAAPFERIFRYLFSFALQGFDIYLSLFVPLTALLTVGFLLSGYFDIGCGITACLGIRLQTEDGKRATLPALLLEWLKTYVYTPLQRLPKIGRHLAAPLTAAVLLPLLRLSPSFWLLCLPAALLLTLLLYANKGTLPRIGLTLWLLSPLLCLPATALLIREPEMLLPWSALFPGFRENGFYLSTNLIEEIYRAFLSLGLLIPPTLLFFIKRLTVRGKHPRYDTVIRSLELLMTLVYFALTTVYFLPKFPAYATALPQNVLW